MRLRRQGTVDRRALRRHEDAWRLYGLRVQRRQLVQRVASALQSSETVAYPDHPLLLRGPDILALSRGALTAYFVYNGHGPRPTSRQERARFLLVRLAMPPGTACVLVVDAPATVSFTPADLLLDEVVTLRELRVFDRSRPEFSLGQSAEVIEDVRSFHNQRFAEAWTQAFDIPRRLRVRSETPGEPTSETASRRGDLGRLRWMGVDNGILYARSEARTSADLRRAVARTNSTAVSLDYDLSLGLSGVAETSAKLRSGRGHLAVHHFSTEVATRKPSFDAFKPQRAAAFAGVEAIGFEVPE